MWVLCNPSNMGQPLLLTIQSNEDCFGRGIVNYEGCMVLEEVDVEKYISDFASYESVSDDTVS